MELSPRGRAYLVLAITFSGVALILLWAFVLNRGTLTIHLPEPYDVEFIGSPLLHCSQNPCVSRLFTGTYNATIKKSADRDDAHKNLVAQFKLSYIQANAILEMRLQTLAALERQKIEDELKEKKKLIEELEILLKSHVKIRKVIGDDLAEIKAKYADPRRTKVVAGGLK